MSYGMTSYGVWTDARWVGHSFDKIARDNDCARLQKCEAQQREDHGAPGDLADAAEF